MVLLRPSLTEPTRRSLRHATSAIRYLSGSRRCLLGAADRLRQLMPKGLQWYWKVDFFEQITDEAIAVHRRYGETIPTPLSTLHMYPISGAAARVPRMPTAFAYRNGGWVGVVAGIDPDPANLPAAARWAQHYWQELHDSSAGEAT